MQNEELTITAGDEHAGVQKAYSIPQVKLEKSWYDIAQASAHASAGLQARHREPTPISVLKILGWCRTAWRLGVERYRQRRQLREMDDRQLQDIGTTREQADKPIWKGWQMAAARNWPKFEYYRSGSCRSWRTPSVFTSVIIRRAELADAESISVIYNEAILATTATFDIEPKDVAERIEWLKLHDDRHPVLVALSENKIVGWSALSRWSERRAYDDTAETSCYVRSDFRGHGIGRKLKEAIIEEARRLGFHTLIARVAEGSEESLHLNASMGFDHVGTLKEVGRKFGRLIDVHILQKMLRPTDE